MCEKLSYKSWLSFKSKKWIDRCSCFGPKDIYKCWAGFENFKLWVWSSNEENKWNKMLVIVFKNQYRDDLVDTINLNLALFEKFQFYIDSRSKC